MARPKIYRVKVVKEGCPTYCEPLNHPKSVSDFLKKVMGSDTRDLIVAIFLHTKNIPLMWSIISIGFPSSSLVHPCDVFAPGMVEQGVYTEAIAQKAACVIVTYNHPSGDATPSPEDTSLTQRLVAAGNILGIDRVDHLIIGDTG